MSTVARSTMTAEEYALLPANGVPSELVKGQVIELNPPTPAHGRVCAKFVWLFMNHTQERKLGYVVSNDAAVITRRGPDSVRGADMAFYSSSRVTIEQFDKGYLPIVPNLVVEVRSKNDRWSEILEKVAEYLQAGVSIVCVADPEPQTVHIFRADQPVQLLNEDQEFVLPELFPDFRVPVRKFFE